MILWRMLVKHVCYYFYKFNWNLYQPFHEIKPNDHLLIRSLKKNLFSGSSNIPKLWKKKLEILIEEQN